MISTEDAANTTLCDEGKVKYISDVDCDDTPSPFRRSSRSPFSRFLAIVLLTCAVAIIFITAALAQQGAFRRYDQCGTTSDEARARGCVFETTGFTWLPKRCQDSATEEEFLQYILQHEISIYRDANLTDVVSISEVRLGNGPGFFVRQQYHVTHCLFLLKKLHRVSSKGRMVDGQILPTHHTEHCVHQTLKTVQTPEWRKDLAQFSYTKFPYCGKIGGYNVGWNEKLGKATGWVDS